MACKSCENNLGEFPHNEDISLPDDLLAPDNGNYVVRLVNGMSVRYLKQEKEAGDGFTIPKGTLNEEMIYEFTIIKPDGTNLQYEECENFKLKTFIATGPCGTHCPDEVGGGSEY